MVLFTYLTIRAYILSQRRYFMLLNACDTLIHLQGGHQIGRLLFKYFTKRRFTDFCSALFWSLKQQCFGSILMLLVIFSTIFNFFMLWSNFKASLSMLVSSVLQAPFRASQSTYGKSKCKRAVRQRIGTGGLSISRRKQIVLNFNVNAGDYTWCILHSLY